MTQKYNKKYITISTLIGIINGFIFAILLILLLRFYLGSQQTKNNFKNILENNDLFSSTKTNYSNMETKQYKLDTSNIDDSEYKKKFNTFIINLSIISFLIIIICSHYILKLGNKFDYLDWFLEVLVVIFIIVFNLLYFNIISKNYTLYNIAETYNKLIKYNQDDEYYYEDCNIENKRQSVLDSLINQKSFNLKKENIDIQEEQIEEESE